MGLADALKAEIDKGHAKRCSICTMIDRMTPADAKALTEAFADRNLSTSAIARALQAEGYDATANNVGRHRRGDCRR